MTEAGRPTGAGRDPARLAIWSVAVGIAVFALKWLAYLLTGSVALYSDALESVVNIAAALLALVAIRVSAIPADHNHPYGHSKAEYLSAVAEGALIVLAAALILREAAFAFLAPRAIAEPVAGLLVNGVATVVNGVWAGVLIRAGTSARSPALAADGHHLMTDVMTSVGVIAGVLAAAATGWLWLDPALAVLVACAVLWSGWTLMRASIGGLMDAAPDAAILDRARDLIAASAGGAIQAHDLRMRRTARTLFVEFHLIVPGAMTVSRSHGICDRIETALRAEFEDVAISIHVEPDHKGKEEDAFDVG